MPRSARVARMLFALGVAFVVLAVVLFAIPHQESSFGWYANAPLSSTTSSPPLADTRTVIALSAAAIGLVLMAGCAGWWLGRRARGAA
jgi:heme/copper-type cytochrome/quinol oxidase subunit 1